MRGLEPERRGWRSFARLWAAMFLSYAVAKLLFNYASRDVVDLRPVFFEELALLPLGQTAVYWAVTRARRNGGAPRPGAKDTSPLEESK